MAFWYTLNIYIYIYFVNLYVSYHKLCAPLDSWGRMGWFSSILVLWDLKCKGSYLELCYFITFGQHPRLYATLLKEGGKKKSWEVFFSPNCTTLLPITPAWFVFITQMSPKQVPTGWKRKQSEGSRFFPEVSLTSSASRWDLDTYQPWKVGFPEKLEKEIYSYSQNTPAGMSYHFHSVCWGANCKEQA